jgi:hypothetical protein
MNLGQVMRAFDAVMAFRDAAKRVMGDAPPATGIATQSPAPEQRIAGQLEATLTNVVVAALKEAFERDRARLDLERLQIDEQRRRAEETLRLELRRQAVEREIGRLRLLAGTALVGWIASVVLFIVRTGVTSTPSRVAVACGWVLLLGALGAAFSAQGSLSAHAAASDGDADMKSARGPSGAATAALWLLMTGLAVSAVSLLV